MLQMRDYRDFAYDDKLDYVFAYPMEYDGVTYTDGDAVPEFVKELRGGSHARILFNLHRIRPAVPYPERMAAAQKSQTKPKRKRKVNNDN